MNIKVFKIEYIDYLDVAVAVGKVSTTEELDMNQYKFFANQMKKTKYIEGKTRTGAISNLKNILYSNHLEIISATTV